jgi:tape measure domain-containing protein
MAKVIDDLITRYSLDDRQYKAGANSVLDSTGKIGEAFGALSIVAAAMGVAVAGAAVKLAGLAGNAIQAYAEFESLELAMKSVSGSAEAARRNIERLKDIATLPGLGFKEAIQGSIRLQAAGFSARLAERALIGFGKAIAEVGGGKAELDGVILALTQIASKSTLSAEEINQIAERVPRIRQILKQAFGTADVEQVAKMATPTVIIEKIIDELEKLPQQGDSVKNFFENLGDTISQAWAQAGEALAKRFMPELKSVANFFSNLVASGVFTTIADSIGRVVDGFARLFGFKDAAEGLKGFLAFVLTAIEAMPTIIDNVIEAFVNFFNRIVDGLNAVKRFIAPFIPDLRHIDKPNRMDAGSDFAKLADTLGFFGAFTTRMGDILKKGSEKPRSTGVLEDTSKGTSTALSTIATNTYATVKELEKSNNFRSQILGGGQVGSKGIAAIELFGTRPRPASRGTVLSFGEWSKVIDALESIMEKKVQEQAIYNARA